MINSSLYSSASYWTSDAPLPDDDMDYGHGDSDAEQLVRLRDKAETYGEAVNYLLRYEGPSMYRMIEILNDLQSLLREYTRVGALRIRRGQLHSMTGTVLMGVRELRTVQRQIVVESRRRPKR